VSQFDGTERGALLGFIRRKLGGNETDAEDLTHDVYVRLLKRPGSLLENPMAYAVSTTHNVIRDHFKRKQREGERIIFNTEEAESAAEKTPDPSQDRAQTHEEDLSDLKKITQALPKNFREVILLYYAEGLSTGEVATRMGLAKATVVKYRTMATHTLQDLKDT
jgi:RNA polymerase sigma factor (sigma-70 family)